ncbi:aminotransferase class V-fold PLP-dependent enzyme [Pseudomonadota bacterium]
MKKVALDSILPQDSNQQLFDRLVEDTVGLNVEYRLADGRKTRRTYLDNAASTLQLGVVKKALENYLPYYSNTHTTVHFGGQLSNCVYQWAHDEVLRFVNADAENYACFFLGSGTTAGLNRVANTLKESRPDRDVVITSIMEHHSNDLPHRRHFKEVVHVPAVSVDNKLGCVDLDRLEQELVRYARRVNYISLTGVSNVTGVINPIHEIARLAHRYDTLLVVDAAHMGAHVPIQVSVPSDTNSNIDVLVLSGHKMYAPGSPGVVVTRKDLFLKGEPVEVGGGMVEDVHINHYLPVTKFPDREEAGTPNIVGAVALATAVYALRKIGMREIEARDHQLINYALETLKQVDRLIIYGETDQNLCKRAGAVSFNIEQMDHGLVAAVLNDYFNISVRNACFCAHPYVREMITDNLSEIAGSLSDAELEALAEMHRGMVRASVAIYNTTKDIDDLGNALNKISRQRDFYEKQYARLASGDYEHKTFKFEHQKLFSIEHVVDTWLNEEIKTSS